MPPTKFYLERQTAPHHGDRIYFQTHPERSLSIEDAIELCVQLAALINDPKAISKRFAEVAPNKVSYAVVEKSVPPSTQGMSARRTPAPSSPETRGQSEQPASAKPSSPETRGQSEQPASAKPSSPETRGQSEQPASAKPTASE
jgi:hypothetical protein